MLNMIHQEFDMKNNMIRWISIIKIGQKLIELGKNSNKRRRDKKIKELGISKRIRIGRDWRCRLGIIMKEDSKLGGNYRNRLIEEEWDWLNKQKKRNNLFSLCSISQQEIEQELFNKKTIEEIYWSKLTKANRKNILKKDKIR